MYAIENNYINTLQFDDKGQHIIHRAISMGNFEIVVSLIEKHKLDIDIRTLQNKQTPLMFASNSGNIKLIKYLLAKGADINAKDINSYCPLMYAVMQRHKIAVVYLISKGSNIETIDYSGCNIAHWAAYNNDIFMVELIY